MTTLLPPIPVRLLALVAVAVMAAAGCSGGVGKVTVQGTISYKGQPLRSGLLKFVGPGATYSAASIQPDGKFIITDVVPGEVKVGVMETPRGSGAPSSNDQKTSSRPPPPPVSLPEKYRNPETSGLTYTITPSTTELTIDIQ